MKTTTYFAAAGAAVVLACAGDAQGEALKLSARATETSHLLGEPIWIELAVENTGDREATLDLGTSDVSSLHVTWSRSDGSGEKAKPVERRGSAEAGLRPHHVVKIAAGKSHRLEFLLQKLLVPDQAGNYDLKVALQGVKAPSAVTRVGIEPASSRILAARLEARLKEWHQAAAKARDTGAATSRKAIESLVYTRAQPAFPYQKQLLEGSLLDQDQLNALVLSMLAEDGTESAVVSFLVEKLQDRTGSASLRQTILYALKFHGLEKLNPRSARLLEPFKAEIQRAAPIVISN
jgi:hypothetical protein